MQLCSSHDYFGNTNNEDEPNLDIDGDSIIIRLIRWHGMIVSASFRIIRTNAVPDDEVLLNTITPAQDSANAT